MSQGQGCVVTFPNLHGSQKIPSSKKFQNSCLEGGLFELCFKIFFSQRLYFLNAVQDFQKKELDHWKVKWSDTKYDPQHQLQMWCILQSVKLCMLIFLLTNTTLQISTQKKLYARVNNKPHTVTGFGYECNLGRFCQLKYAFFCEWLAHRKTVVEVSVIWNSTYILVLVDWSY